MNLTGGGVSRRDSDLINYLAARSRISRQSIVNYFTSGWALVFRISARFRRDSVNHQSSNVQSSNCNKSSFVTGSKSETVYYENSCSFEHSKYISLMNYLSCKCTLYASMINERERAVKLVVEESGHTLALRAEFSMWIFPKVFPQRALYTNHAERSRSEETEDMSVRMFSIARPDGVQTESKMLSCGRHKLTTNYDVSPRVELTINAHKNHRYAVNVKHTRLGSRHIWRVNAKESSSLLHKLTEVRCILGLIARLKHESLGIHSKSLAAACRHWD